MTFTIGDVIKIPHAKDSAMRQAQLRQCVDKDKYATRYTASVACREVAVVDEERKIPYKCRWCGFWHIGKPKHYE